MKGLINVFFAFVLLSLVIGLGCIVGLGWAALVWQMITNPLNPFSIFGWAVVLVLLLAYRRELWAGAVYVWARVRG